MVGGSVAAGLRARGWHVTGADIEAAIQDEALRRGIIDAAGRDSNVDITIIATPVSSVVDAAQQALRETTGFVTDVASVKGDIVAAIDHERFVGGHPMAGSEQSGLAGVDPDLFAGAAWVLTTRHDGIALAAVRDVVETLGAIPIELDATEHDRAVAVISHVPHLVAATLMRVASQRGENHEATLRLAAGGFRDMTRIAAGDAPLWTDIIFSNKYAVLEGLDEFIAACTVLREALCANLHQQFSETLGIASHARRMLPARKGPITQYAVVHVPIPDRPGALGAVIAVFTELRVNVEDLELSHDPKGDRGTLSVTVSRSDARRVQEEMRRVDIHVAVEELEP